MTEQEYMDKFSLYRFDVEPSWPLYNLLKAIRDNHTEFQILGIEYENEYFPEYLKSRFEQYLTFYREKLKPIIASLPFTFDYGNLEDVVENDILQLSSGIEQVIDKYFEGSIHEATIKFNNLLNLVTRNRRGMRVESLISESIETGTTFYRARPSTSGRFTKSDLFHIPFQLRHFASTNRYSVPGILGLYLSTDPYTCFMELNRPELKTLNYSRFENTSKLNIIKIQRIEEAIHETLRDNLHERTKGNPIVLAWEIEGITNYLGSFPLVISCTTKVKNDKGNFKPEYITPQLLIQNLVSNQNIDGIKYPSSKVKLPPNDAGEIFYNYVFPVKSVHKTGFCTNLSNLFKLTEPTSLELEGIQDSYIINKGANSLFHIANSLEGKKVLPIC